MTRFFQLVPRYSPMPTDDFFSRRVLWTCATRLQDSESHELPHLIQRTASRFRMGDAHGSSCIRIVRQRNGGPNRLQLIEIRSILYQNLLAVLKGVIRQALRL